jgi:DNA mismatch repair ATPase MutS
MNGILPWDIYFVRRLEQCRKEISGLLPAWLEVFAELEALSSLANFARLNPGFSYPVIDSETARKEVAPEPGRRGAGSIPPMRLQAEHMGHPLISAQTRIRNSFILDECHRIALITGSNMSGKSSFLRTLGVNLCLAYAGAPVCAARLRTSLFRIFACMRIDDSLADGFSLFYAEVKRLKMLLSTVESHAGFPVIFLLDEIFRGTNNKERFIGSQAFIRALAKHPAIGAIATHDLELVKLADENGAITNYHFREDVEAGRMIFDYRLRPGPCPTTNALKIMAMAGLPVL